MKNKIISIEEAANMLKSGMTLMAGGFLGVGGPNKIMDVIAEKDIKDLTLIANDTAFIDTGIGKLVAKKMLKKVIASHIGTNKETGNQMNSGELEVELSPQGTLAERVRAGGYGLGGILTPTGIDTVVEEGKQIIESDGKKYILEKPLKAEIAYLKGAKADKDGNIFCAKSTKNFNALMAFAADVVVVEVEEIMESGNLDPEIITIPCVLVDYVVKA